MFLTNSRFSVENTEPRLVQILLSYFEGLIRGLCRCLKTERLLTPNRPLATHKSFTFDYLAGITYTLVDCPITSNDTMRSYVWLLYMCAVSVYAGPRLGNREWMLVLIGSLVICQMKRSMDIHHMAGGTKQIPPLITETNRSTVQRTAN